MGTAKARDIGALLRDGERSFSFEFFPPKDEDGERVLWQSIRELEPLRPTFVSVTYGAGGTTRDRTVAITRRIAQETSMLPMAHLTCVGHTTGELAEVVRQLSAAGVRNVLALRGDPPGGPGTAWVPTPDGVDYASDLVAFLKAEADVSVGVAAFPEGHRDAASLDDDTAVLKAKRDAGAEFAVTEMVLRASDYFGLVGAGPGPRRRLPDRARDHADPEPRLDAQDGGAVGPRDPRRGAGPHPAAPGRPGGAAGGGRADRHRALRHAPRGRRTRACTSTRSTARRRRARSSRACARRSDAAAATRLVRMDPHRHRHRPG